MDYRSDIAEKVGYDEFPDTTEGIIDQMCIRDRLCTADDGRHDCRLLFLAVHCGSAVHHVGCA